MLAIQTLTELIQKISSDPITENEKKTDERLAVKPIIVKQQITDEELNKYLEIKFFRKKDILNLDYWKSYNLNVLTNWLRINNKLYCWHEDIFSCLVTILLFIL